MSRNIVFEGWLTKSPPSKRIWRTKWRRRWFALRQSGELPGQYFLDYYADRNSRRLKGTINLDLCEQVDAGLHMERAGNGTLDPKLRGSVFTIQTQSRTYHLEADCEAEMGKWVDIICRVCGLRPTDESNDPNDAYQRNNNAVTAYNVHYTCPNSTGTYIPISECITGVRSQDQTAFNFDPKNIVMSTQKSTCDKATETTDRIYRSPPQIRITNADFSENESNLSDEDCKSLNASQPNITKWAVTKTFTRLAIADDKNEISEDGPPVPPRPPKTFARPHVVHKESFQGPRIQEPVESVQESIAKYAGPGTPWLRMPQRKQHHHRSAPHSPSRLYPLPSHNTRYTDDEDDYTPGNQSSQYYNMPTLPPAVDRALKPRHSHHIIGHIHTYGPKGPSRIDCSVHQYAEIIDNDESFHADEIKSDKLQYLTLDLQTATLPKAKNFDVPRKEDVVRGLSASDADADSGYKTVDFLKTEAFNSTREDAEAFRSHH